MRLIKDEEIAEGAEEVDQEVYERELARPLKKQVESRLEEADYEMWFACDGC